MDDRRPAAAKPANSGSPLPVVCAEVLLLRARTDCPKCGERTSVYAVLGRPEFETADQSSSLVRRISVMPAEIDKAVRTFSAGRWRRDRSEKAAGAHWHSHCQRCDGRLGESFVLGAEGPFRPALYKDRRAIAFERLPGPIVFPGAQRQSSLPLMAWLDWMRQRATKAAKPARAAKAPKSAKAGTAAKPAKPAESRKPAARTKP